VDKVITTEAAKISTGVILLKDVVLSQWDIIPLDGPWGPSNFTSRRKTKKKEHTSITSRYMASPGTGKFAQARECCEFQRRHF